MTVKADWLDGDTFAAADENAHATQTNTNTTDIAARVVGESSSADSEVALFSGTGGKTIKRATGSGIPKLTSGVLGSATAGTDYVAPGGALGTPSSGTLTNCTGLPLSSVVDSTSEALGAGSIELGHASDTTISRTGAGAIAVEGVGVALNSTSATHTAGTLELGAASDTTLSRASAGVLAVEGVNVLLTGGAIGTPSSGTLTNCTGLPLSGVTDSTSEALGVGTLEVGHASDTTISRVSAGVIAVEGTNVILNGGALGTPASGTLTNCTGLPVAGVAGDTSTALGVGSINLGHASDTTITRTGAGAIAVEGTAVLLSGGALGTPSSGNASNLTSFPTLNQNTTGSAATLTTPRTINGVSFNGSANIVVIPRVGTTTSSATPSIDCALFDQYNITALAANITGITVSNTYDGCKLAIRFTGTATRTIVHGSSFMSSGVATLLATTSGTNTHLAFYVYDGVKTKFVCYAVDAVGC